MARTLKLAAQGLALAAVAGLLLLLVWRVVRDERGNAASAVAAGKTVAAPAFRLPHLGGRGKLSLASLRGKGVVVNFWASWCVPCKQESGFLERTWRDNRGRGLVVVGVNEEDFSTDARKFVRRYGITYPIVRDRKGDLIDDYGLSGYPETFVVNRRGRLIEHLSGAVDRGVLKERFERAVERALA